MREHKQLPHRKVHVRDDYWRCLKHLTVAWRGVKAQHDTLIRVVDVEVTICIAHGQLCVRWQSYMHGLLYSEFPRVEIPNDDGLKSSSIDGMQ